MAYKGYFCTQNHVMRKVLLFGFLILSYCGIAQQHARSLKNFWQPADSLNKTRFWVGVGSGTAISGGTVLGLYHLWYKGYPTSPFHLFNDWDEWKNLDKAGHMLTAYNECVWSYKTFRWMGVSDKRAIWTAFGIGTGLQLSLETLDGISEKWGFSLGDITFNTLGCVTFATQQMVWGEQRIMLKAGSWHGAYPETKIISTDGLAETTLRQRAAELYGTNYAQTFFKDYNAMSTWASVNIASFLPKDTWVPKWLNVAVGYGADNLYAGYGNTWEQGGHTFVLSPTQYPASRQFFLSLDLDLTKFRTKPGPIRVLLYILNSIKIPSPTLEINSLGKAKFHAIYF